MKRVRFLMIGGFLGAGKTTAIARIARSYIEQGLQVGLVTNDQAYDLVDTHSLRAQGFRVGEVPGACFCCKFDDLVDTIGTLREDEQPDLIVAEPVGSCTDLVATVIEPMRQLYGQQYDIGPLAVLLKPEHGTKILRQEAGAGFSPKAAYIFLKQLEEADLIVINKSDKLSPEHRTELIQLVQERFPNKSVLSASGRFGDGFDEVLQALKADVNAHQQMMDVDYDTYADGEAELGWLNCQVKVRGADSREFLLDDFLVTLVRTISEGLSDAKGEAAHLKVMGQSAEASALANLVDSSGQVELSMESRVKVRAADIIINARVALAPDRLEEIVRRAVTKAAEHFALQRTISGMQRFRPSRPIPTHRVTNR